MRINNNNRQLGTEGTQGTNGVDSVDSRSSSRGVKRAGHGHDRTELSALAKPIADLISGQSPERLNRVEQLREAVAAGHYQTDSKVVSSKLVDDAIAHGGE
jgi:flagellar biosynthesis anti-sigma factor FlgM